MKIHVFGRIWCPSAATYALRACQKLCPGDYCPLVYTAINNEFYVNDWLSSFVNVKLAITILHELRALLRAGGFNLTQVASNRREVVESLAVTDLAKVITLSISTMTTFQSDVL